MSLPLFANLSRFAVRPMTVQRDELGRIMMWAVCKSPFVSIPYEQGSRLCFVEKNTASHGYAALAKRMVVGWEDHLSSYEKTVTNMKDIATSAAKAVTKEAMYETYHAWGNILTRYADYLLAPFSVELILDPQCRELLAQQFPEHAEEYFTIISSPDTMHEYQRMREKIFLAAVAQDISEETCGQLAKDYGWYNEYSYIEPLLDAAYFKQEIAGIPKEYAQEELEKMHADLAQAREAYASLIVQITEPELKQLATILHTYTMLRTERMDHFKHAQATMRIFFDHVALFLSKETGKPWTRHEVVSLTHKEILDYLSQHITPSFDLATKRVLQHYIYHSTNGEAQFIMHPTDIAAFVQSVTEEDKTTSTKGTIAFKGMATGKVAVIKGKHDLHKVQPGDILIAPTTMPDYLPAMNKAIAFVTDEGGITSHAAIVARELKKPCIVGTKKATQIFKDGDVVEVDAETGIVTLLT